MPTLILMLLGCATEVREAERRQRALASEIDTLEAEVAQLRTALKQSGIRVEGRKRALSGDRRRRNRGKQPPPSQPAPIRSAASDIERIGDIPTLETPSPTRAEGPCGYRLNVPALKRISDFQLVQRGKGKSSPIRLSIDGVELKPHAFPKDFQQCGGGMRHAGTVVLFAPPAPTDQLGELDLHLAAEFPLPGADGAPKYWIYPGQHVTITAEGTSDGPTTLQVGADSTAPPRVQVDGEPLAADGALPGQGPWTIRIDAEGYTLLESVTLVSDGTRTELL